MIIGIDPHKVSHTATLDAALDPIGPDDSTTRAQLLACLAEEIDPRDAIRRSEMASEAIDIARRTGDDATLLAVLTIALTPLMTPDTLDRRLSETSVALNLAERSGDVISRCQVLLNRAQAVMETGDIDEFDACLTEMQTIAERTGLPFQWWQVFMLRSWRHLLAGRAGEAEADSNALLDVGTRIGLSHTVNVYGAQLLQRSMQQGRLSEFVDVAAQGLAENPTIPSWRMVLMNIYRELGRYDDCAALFDSGYAPGFSDHPFNVMWTESVCVYADCAADMGRTDAARRLYELLRPYASRFVFLACNEHGVAARPLGRYGDAETHLRAALALHERIQAPYWIARTHLDLPSSPSPGATRPTPRQRATSYNRRSAASRATAMPDFCPRQTGCCSGYDIARQRQAGSVRSKP